MRTTVTLDSDTEQLVRERMRRDGVSFKQTLNDAIRSGARAGGSPRAPYFTPVRSLGQPVLSLDRALRIAADLDDDELVQRMRAGS